MLDAGHAYTDEMIKELEKKMKDVYGQAAKEMEKKVNDRMAKYEENLKKKQQDFDSGKITKKDFDTWKKNQAAIIANKTALKDVLTQDLLNADKISADMINGSKSSAYAYNYNYGTYQIEVGANVNTSFVLFDTDTVERIIKDNPDLLPKTKLDIPKAQLWEKQKIGNALVQGILQGESIPKIAKRLRETVGMEYRSSVRNARTAMTSAQNAGRVNAYKRGQALGIDVQQEWLATLDNRTRHSHRRLDGERIKLDGVFSNKCRFPGDPQGPGYEVYNCRCTLIPVIAGHEYDETWKEGEIIDGLPYKEWKKHGSGKKTSFDKWEMEQAAPDAAIMSVWSGMKMSNIYNLIKAQNSSDANKFYKELGKLGKPSETWDKYLKGELDADELAKFEDILKKYLPKDVNAGSVASDVTQTVTKTTEKISKAAQDSLDDLKFKAGNPMDKDAADTYKVNPFYEKGVDATTNNCQTCAYAYECRRQGYDVIASPKWGLDYDDPELKEILDLQNEIGLEARLGWINKETGHSPIPVLEQGNKNFLDTKANMVKSLENAVGNDGERYIMGVRWKNGGAHAINVDRTPDGKLRIVDNQRGPLEKNTWIGKEAEDYLDKVKNIRHLTRVDDCVPNAEYFNNILLDPNKIKTGLPNKITSTDPKHKKLYDVAKAKGENPSVYYVKWKSGLIDDKDMDDVIPVLTPKEIKASLPKKFADLSDTQKAQLQATLKSKTNNVDTYYYKWKLGINQDDDLDSLFGIKKTATPKPATSGINKAASIPKPSVETKATSKAAVTASTPKPALTSNVDLDTLKNKKVTQIYNEIKDDVGSKEANAFYKELKNIGEVDHLKQGDVWKKYLAGELDANDVAKIEKYLDKYKVADKVADDVKDVIAPASKIDNLVNFDDVKNKSLNDILNDNPTLWSKLQSEIGKNAKGSYVAYWDDYINGKINDPDLDKLFASKSAAKTAASKATPAPSVPTIDFDAIKDKKMSAVFNEIKATDTKTANKFYNELKKMGKPSEVWDDYLNGAISAENQKKIEDILIKHYNTGGTAKVATKAAEKSDDIIKLEKQIDKIDNQIDAISQAPDQYAFLLHGKVQTFDDIAWNIPGTNEDKLKKLMNMGATPKNGAAKAAIDALDEKQNLKGQILSLQNEAKTAATKSDDLIKAEEKLKKAQDELAKVSNPTYSGIWKEDVTLADYEAKKGTIKAKKIYYEDEINKLKNDPSYKPWFSDEDKQHKIWDLQHLHDDLDDFEKEGKKYAKLQKAVTEAQKEVRSLTPVGEAYTEERKANALWVKTKSGAKFDEADKYYDSVAKVVHGSKTSIEHEGYYHYTWGSGPFNQPLAGFDGSWSNPSPLGPGKFNIDKNGYGDKIRGLTSLCEKSKYDRDFWCQTGQDEITLESFLGIKPGTLANMTEAEAQQFVGVQNEIPQFISTAINKGGGSYNPGNMTFNIYVPEGSEALYVREDGHFGKAEHEMILQRGGTYKVSKLYKASGLHGRDEWIVDLEVHPEYGYDKFQQTK